MLRRCKLALGCALVLALSLDCRAQAPSAAAPNASPLTVFITASTPDHSPLVSSDLRVTIGRKPVQVLSLRPAPTHKLLFALLVDASGSEKADADAIRRAAVRIFQHLASQGGVGYLGTFGTRLHLSPAPVPAGDVAGSLAHAHFHGQTALYDSLVACSHQLSRRAHPDFPRRVIILISDGDDNASHTWGQKAIKAAEGEGISVFWLDTLGIQDQSSLPIDMVWGGQPLEAVRSEEDLHQMAHDTGGEVIMPPPRKCCWVNDGRSDLNTATASLLKALNQQWELTIAAPAGHDGQLHALEVRTSQKQVRIFAPAHLALR
jgi:Mg-chelatase subunit ChlD